LFCGLFGTAFSYTKWLPLNLKVLIPNFPVKSADLETAPTQSHPVFPGFSSSHPRIALVALSRIDREREKEKEREGVRGEGVILIDTTQQILSNDCRDLPSCLRGQRGGCKNKT
jgi:hypothetical protein